MKHYVLGFVFNRTRDKVLLVEKRKPVWQAGHWNGIGGKIEPSDPTPVAAMQRECLEETGLDIFITSWVHCITFTCPGGTVYIFKTSWNMEDVPYEQLEDELLQVWDLDFLPKSMMSNLKWLIPICLSTIQFPLLVSDTTLGI